MKQIGVNPYIENQQYSIGFVTDHACTEVVFLGLQGIDNKLKLQLSDTEYQSIPIPDAKWLVTSTYTDVARRFTAQVVDKNDKRIENTNLFTFIIRPSVGGSESEKEVVPPAFKDAYDKMVDTADEIQRKADSGEFDGFSPTVKTEPVDTGNKVTITDRDGEKSFIVKDAVPPVGVEKDFVTFDEMGKMITRKIEVADLPTIDEMGGSTKTYTDEQDKANLDKAKKYTDEKASLKADKSGWEKSMNLVTDESGNMITMPLSKGEVISVNGKKGNVVLKAQDIDFDDGQNFQEKLNNGELNGKDGTVEFATFDVNENMELVMTYDESLQKTNFILNEKGELEVMING